MVFILRVRVGVKLRHFFMWSGACVTHRLVIAFALFKHVDRSLSTGSKEGVLGCTLMK